MTFAEFSSLARGLFPGATRFEDETTKHGGMAFFTCIVRLRVNGQASEHEVRMFQVKTAGRSFWSVFVHPHKEMVYGKLTGEGALGALHANLQPYLHSG